MKFWNNLRKGSASSHLFQRVASFLHHEILEQFKKGLSEFSSLSESGFIPTQRFMGFNGNKHWARSHLFQRVASFLLGDVTFCNDGTICLFSSLSESGFIPTTKNF